MFIFYRKEKKYVSWAFHELAWSLRTSGMPIWIIDETGKEVVE